MSRFVGSSVLRGGSSISLQLPPLPLPRWWSLVLAQLEPGRKEAREAEGSDTNPRGDAFYGDGRLVEACRHVQRGRRRVGSRDRSPRRTPTEITGSRNRRDTPLITDIFAMERGYRRCIDDIAGATWWYRPLVQPTRILLLRSTIFVAFRSCVAKRLVIKVSCEREDIEIQGELVVGGFSNRL